MIQLSKINFQHHMKILLLILNATILRYKCKSLWMVIHQRKLRRLSLTVKKELWPVRLSITYVTSTTAFLSMWWWHHRKSYLLQIIKNIFEWDVLLVIQYKKLQYCYHNMAKYHIFSVFVLKTCNLKNSLPI